MPIQLPSAPPAAFQPTVPARPLPMLNTFPQPAMAAFAGSTVQSARYQHSHLLQVPTLPEHYRGVVPQYLLPEPALQHPSHSLLSGRRHRKSFLYMSPCRYHAGVSTQHEHIHYRQVNYSQQQINDKNDLISI